MNLKRKQTHEKNLAGIIFTHQRKLLGILNQKNLAKVQ